MAGPKQVRGGFDSHTLPPGKVQALSKDSKDSFHKFFVATDCQLFRSSLSPIDSADFVSKDRI